ncbi:IclR family transcriptional regulator [Stutzerimonas azotifigens]|uniref:IclR family transcriptional regulator n=1 Tax=Stutzerimonas azotifigens TaxID=291995 RepID=UPI0003FCD1FE|nr:IclR family transcriptional regulator [Stutzerimonas azotifigens]
METNKRRILAPAVERSIRLLALLEATPQHRFSLTEISRALDIPKSTALNLCSELLEGQLIRRSSDGYQLGRRLVQLGSAYVSSVDLVREFYNACQFMPPELNAMVQLAVLDEELNAVYLARQDCNSGLRLGLRAEIGRRVPANCTGIGKALLAALPSHELEKRLTGIRTLPTLTERSISNPDQLRDRLHQIRRDRFAIDDEEVLPGVSCVAMAVQTASREDGVIAISVTAQKEGQSQERIEEHKNALFQVVERLAQQI